MPKKLNLRLGIDEDLYAELSKRAAREDLKVEVMIPWLVEFGLRYLDGKQGIIQQRLKVHE